MIKHKHVLGFDFGHKKIGVAIGQTITATASPLTTITVTQSPPWKTIEALIQEWQPSDIVVGLPLDLDGKLQAISQSAQQFSNTLVNKFQKRYNLKIHMHDERFSSQASESLFRQQRGKNQASRDAIAASLILESWLHQQAAHLKDEQHDREI